MRAKAHVEQMERNKSRIVITELPYQANKTNLLGRIADLHRDGKIEGLDRFAGRIGPEWDAHHFGNDAQCRAGSMCWLICSG